jgi:hypothetical protein
VPIFVARLLPVLAIALLLSACATAPVTGYTAEGPPGVTDRRARFAEIVCAMLKERGATLPDPSPISNFVSPTYQKLSKIDPRNDSQLIYSDQIIPGGTLAGFLDADHWAVNVPIDRAHAVIGSAFANHDDYPRQALFEALPWYVEAGLSARAN